MGPGDPDRNTRGMLDAMTADPRPRFVVLVPVKATDVGKSRLVGISPSDRSRLARAFALDTISAVRATPSVGTTVVVTSDDDLARETLRLGCVVEPDLGDLNESLRAAAAARSGTVVVVCGDLPALRPDDLADALAQVPPGVAAFVADRDGRGTTTYAAPADRFDPRFGTGSARAHAEAGALAVPGELWTLRHDVDTGEDLVDLASRGLLGRHTSEALEGIGLPRPS